MRNRIYRHSSIDRKLHFDLLRTGTAEHRTIVEHLATRDAQKAADAMREHLENVRNNLFNQLVYS